MQIDEVKRTNQTCRILANSSVQEKGLLKTNLQITWLKTANTSIPNENITIMFVNLRTNSKRKSINSTIFFIILTPNI